MDLAKKAGLRWFTSTRSQGGDNCVEAAFTADGIAIRDSKDPDGGQLGFGADGWRAFIAGVKDGEFDL